MLGLRPLAKPPEMPEIAPDSPRVPRPATVLASQGLRYLVVGGIQLLVDWAIFVGLSALGFPVVASNLVGRAAGAALGFWLNATYTFRDAEGRVAARRWSNGVKFLIGWIVMTALSTVCVSAIDRAVGLQWAWAGKPLVDGVLAVLGFALSKYWIFR